MIYSFLFLIAAILVNIWNAVASPPSWMLIMYYAVLIFTLAKSLISEAMKNK